MAHVLMGRVMVALLVVLPAQPCFHVKLGSLELYHCDGVLQQFGQAPDTGQ